jgi:hypothetical protein
VPVLGTSDAPPYGPRSANGPQRPAAAAHVPLGHGGRGVAEKALRCRRRSCGEAGVLACAFVR